MELRLRNTLKRDDPLKNDTLNSESEKEPFEPLDPARVRMYVCGPTVYDFAHIGNARPVIVFDILFRLLRHLAKEKGWGEVVYVRNITDVDDKINARAAERIAARGEAGADLNAEIRALTEETYKNFTADVTALGCLRPTEEPRATEYVRRTDGKDMISLIETLIRNGNAYVAEGHVLFSVSSMPDYGELSNVSLDEMIAGARVEVAPYKRDPMDFVLWKPSDAAEPGWESPWGRGRPGWHIECSAMSAALLGKEFDIHGGGFDLVFPHHENEIAQSRCAFHTPLMAKTWMHNGFLQVEGAKMSKSLGNFVTIRQLLREKSFGGRRWKGDVIKFAMLQAHYRQPIDWSLRLLQQSESRLEGWKAFAAERTIRKLNRSLYEEFFAALCDDLNTPEAFSLIDMACNRKVPDERDRYTVYRLLRWLGLKNKKSRAAALVEAFDPFLNSISAFSIDHWKRLLENVSVSSLESTEPELRLVASVGAIDRLQDNLRMQLQDRLLRSYDSSHFSNFDAQLRAMISPSMDDYAKRNFLVHRFVDMPEEATRGDDGSLREVAENLLVNFGPIFRYLSTLSTNDWANLAENVRRRPAFSSGVLKPETKLFAYLVALARLSQELQNLISHSADAEQVARFQQKIAEQITPQSGSFERRVQDLINTRNEARAIKDFQESDRIRDALIAMGVELEDHKDKPTTWKRKAPQ
jgi:cysteinyl-tRNA synthetase